MKKLVVVALAMAAATTMYAQATVNMVSDTKSYAKYGENPGAYVTGDRLDASFTPGVLMLGDTEIANAPWGVSTTGKNTGRLNGELIKTDLLPAGALVEGLVVAVDHAVIGGNYKGQSSPFSYTTGDANDPTKLPDASLNFGTFDVNFVPAVPEPTTIALGILGLSSLLLFRRRD